MNQIQRDKPFTCPCTGRVTRACSCMDQVKEHNAAQARVSTAKRLAWFAFGILLALIMVALTGCVSASQGNPYPNGQPQSNVEMWDEEVVEECKQIAVLVVASEYAKMPEPKPTAEEIDAALRFIYGQCLEMKGRTI